MARVTQNNVIVRDARTATGNSADQIVIGHAHARFLLSVTAVAGTAATLDIFIEGKTKSGNYVTIGKFTQTTAEGNQSIEVSRLPPAHRIRWTLGGTNPSFTFEVDAIIVTEN